MFLKTKTVNGHLHVILSKEAINEINSEVIALLDKLFTALNTLDNGGNSNVDNSDLSEVKEALKEYATRKQIADYYISLNSRIEAITRDNIRKQKANRNASIVLAVMIIISFFIGVLYTNSQI